MKISIITVTKNSARSIERTVESVMLQKNVEVEHVIKDADSTDKTVFLAQTKNAKVSTLIQSDTGIYDAMNQGFFFSSGEIVAFLNSDDYYSDENVLHDVEKCFLDNQCDFVYGNIRMVSLAGDTVRVWKVGDIDKDGLIGQQIPHPAFFVRRTILEKLELPFDPSYKISADLKQQLILINKLKLKGVYLNRILTVMETGGESTASFSSYYLGWKESVRAYNEIFQKGGLTFVFLKVLSKLEGLKVLSQFKNFGK